jgi:hypothetical protein
MTDISIQRWQILKHVAELRKRMLDRHGHKIWQLFMELKRHQMFKLERIIENMIVHGVDQYGEDMFEDISDDYPWSSVEYSNSVARMIETEVDDIRLDFERELTWFLKNLSNMSGQINDNKQ